MGNIYHKQDFLAHHNKDVEALNNLITQVLPRCNGLAKRYCKTDEQANELAVKCFLNVLKELLNRKEDEFDETTFLKQFIIYLVKTLLAQRTGILIADTTIVAILKKTQSNLFTNSEYYKKLPADEFIQHIRKLNTLQQIVFNMLVLDNFSITEVAEIIQHSELSIKALIERAKYNLYTSIKSIV